MIQCSQCGNYGDGIICSSCTAKNNRSRELHWKENLSAICPHCNKESDYVFYLNAEEFICNHCDEIFKIKLIVEGIRVEASLPCPCETCNRLARTDPYCYEWCQEKNIRKPF